MASKKKHTSDGARNKAIEAWAEQIADAGKHLSGVRLTELQHKAWMTAHNVAALLSLETKGYAGAVQLAQLERVCSAWQPRTDGEKLATAHRIIRVHVEGTQLRHLVGASVEDRADFLRAELEAPPFPWTV